MPSSYDLFSDFVMMCHPVDGVGHSHPHMCARNEQILINAHLKELSVIFKRELDLSPLSPREHSGTLQGYSSHRRCHQHGSSAGQLHDRFSDLGKTVESLDASGWTMSKATVDALLPVLAENLGQLPESVPVILY